MRKEEGKRGRRRRTKKGRKWRREGWKVREEEGWRRERVSYMYLVCASQKGGHDVSSRLFEVVSVSL